MIHEYAIEPEAVVEWASKRLRCRYIMENFGEGHPRIMTRFPKKWVKQCLDSQSLDDNTRKNLLELVFHLKKCAVRRSEPPYDPACSWMENTEKENQRYPFRAILATSSLNNLDNVLLSHEIGDWQDSPLWQNQRQLIIERTAESMVKTVAPLLQKAREIHFVDPHFTPSAKRFVQPFAAMVKAAVQCPAYPSKERIAYHVSDKWKFDTFYEDCQKYLPARIPVGVKIQFKRWSQRSGGDNLHNRYILTDLGGISFNIGLDTGHKGEIEEITLLIRELWAKRWSQYVSNNGEFDLEQEFTITGKKQERNQIK